MSQSLRGLRSPGPRSCYCKYQWERAFRRHLHHLAFGNLARPVFQSTPSPLAVSHSQGNIGRGKPFHQPVHSTPHVQPMHGGKCFFFPASLVPPFLYATQNLLLKAKENKTLNARFLPGQLLQVPGGENDPLMKATPTLPSYALGTTSNPRCLPMTSSARPGKIKALSLAVPFANLTKEPSHRRVAAPWKTEATRAGN